MAEGAGFSGRYANKPLPDVSGVRFGLKLLPASVGIIVVGESLPTARRRPAAAGESHDERKRFGLLLTALSCEGTASARRRILENVCFRESEARGGLLSQHAV